MYDILQLNDMLVPELLDIAEKLDISNAKKLEKQSLIYKILDKQAVVASEDKKNEQPDGEEKKIRRKRITKKTAEVEAVKTPPPSVEEKEAEPERPRRGRKPSKSVKLE